jgi:transposase
MLQPLVRKTWSRQGDTPILYQCDKRDRLSAISALTVSPRRQHLGLYFRIFRDNIDRYGVRAFIRTLRQHIRSNLIIVLDNWPVHHSKLLGSYFKKHAQHIQVEWLPGYAPQLNPTEQLWSYSKYAAMHNLAPHTVEELNTLVQQRLESAGNNQKLLRSFFKKPGLRICR